MCDVMEKDGIVGMFFHSFEENDTSLFLRVMWQGVVRARVTEEVFLVQLYSWVDGSISQAHLVKLQDMFGWDFYASEEMWQERGSDLTRRDDE